MGKADVILSVLLITGWGIAGIMTYFVDAWDQSTFSAVGLGWFWLIVFLDSAIHRSIRRSAGEASDSSADLNGP